MFNGLSKKLRDLSPNGNGYDDDHSHSKKRHKRSRSREHKRHREKDKHRKHRSRSSERGHRRSKSRSPSRHSKNRSKHRSRSRDRVRSKSRERHHRLSKERYRSKHSPTPTKQELTLEERDQRTVFCMQLAARVRHRDIEDFFSKVGNSLCGIFRYQFCRQSHRTHWNSSLWCTYRSPTFTSGKKSSSQFERSSQTDRTRYIWPNESLCRLSSFQY
ncbi:hypothetical protein SSS_04675 [Sarcoptes scabiei]|nr:hypothetical protein SSS_04675 [Sarcoptes scabiei]